MKMSKQVLDLKQAWMGWSEIAQHVQGKQLVFFGRGSWFSKAINYFTGGSCAYGTQYIVDNNKYEHGREEDGLPIHSPEKLLQEDKDQVFIIITTYGFEEVAQQLMDYGFKPGKHFCITPHLKDFHSVISIKNHKQTIYFTCADQPSNGGGLYKLDVMSGKYERIVSGLCYGITPGKDCFYLVNDDIKGVQILDTQLHPTGSFELPYKSRPHGTAYCPKRDLLYVAFSGRDSFAVFNTKYEMIKEVSLSNKYSKGGISQHQINDLFAYNDSLFVSMFSFSGNWKSGIYDGAILEFDIDELESGTPIVGDLWMPHNPKMINGILHYSDSMRGKIYAGNQKILTEINGFARGLAYDGDFYYVAQSTHRYIDRCPANAANISLDAGIFVVDKEDKITRFIPTSNIISIHDLLVL